MIESIQYVTEDKRAIVFIKEGQSNSSYTATHVAEFLSENGYKPTLEIWSQTGIIVPDVKEGGLDKILRDNFEFIAPPATPSTSPYTIEPRMTLPKDQLYTP